MGPIGYWRILCPVHNGSRLRRHRPTEPKINIFRPYVICCWPEAAGDVISGGILMTIEGYAVTNIEVASSSSFRDIKNIISWRRRRRRISTIKRYPLTCKGHSGVTCFTPATFQLVALISSPISTIVLWDNALTLRLQINVWINICLLLGDTQKRFRLMLSSMSAADAANTKWFFEYLGNC